MKEIKFPYKAYKGGLYPIISLQIKGPKGYSTTEAFVDSGASLSIFMATVAEELGIEFTQGKVHYILVGDGSYIQVYLHKITVQIGTISFPVTMGFSSHLGAEMNLIGQQDFFDRFIITFNKPQGFISLRPFQKKVRR